MTDDEAWQPSGLAARGESRLSDLEGMAVEYEAMRAELESTKSNLEWTSLDE